MNEHVLSNLSNMLAATGFGVVMASVALIGLFMLGAKLSRFWAAFVGFYALFFCVCMAMWAQSINFAHLWNPEAIKYLGITAAALMALWAVTGIIQRAPPGALVGIMAIFMGCGLAGVMSIWSVPKNLLLISLILFVVALVVIIAVCAWALDRRHGRDIEYQALLLDRERSPEKLPYVEPIKRIEHRGNLPVVRKNPFEKWS